MLLTFRTMPAPWTRFEKRRMRLMEFSLPCLATDTFTLMRPIEARAVKKIKSRVFSASRTPAYLRGESVRRNDGLKLGREIPHDDRSIQRFALPDDGEILRVRRARKLDLLP